MHAIASSLVRLTAEGSRRVLVDGPCLVGALGEGVKKWNFGTGIGSQSIQRSLLSARAGPLTLQLAQKNNKYLGETPVDHGRMPRRSKVSLKYSESLVVDPDTVGVASFFPPCRHGLYW
jgi:hypothetical protein